VKEQVKSGFLITGKLVAGFCVAGVFLSGCGLVHEGSSSSQTAIGGLLITLSIVVMAGTVRFWAAGFVGLTALGALRCFGGTLFASSLRVSAPLMLSVSVSLFAMSIVSIRFLSPKTRITRIDRASLVIAAICVLLAFVLMDSYRSAAVLNFGNLALLLSWWAARASRQTSHSVHDATGDG
jgi:hypothetical protein